jgi:hypothetical protein
MRNELAERAGKATNGIEGKRLTYRRIAYQAPEVHCAPLATSAV